MAAQPEIEIPAENLTRQYPGLEGEIRDALAAVLPSGRYILGPNVAAFEGEFAAYCGTKYCLGISSGTEALHLALLACGVGPGDEVITVPNTYIATAFAVSYVGARPVFVDVDPETFNLDVSLVEAAITPRTRAVLPVHMYGQTVDMDSILEIASRRKLWVIEDAAHAHGALSSGRRAGSMGHLGCFSFYPTKVLGCYGDGGAVVTNEAGLYDRVKVLRYMGQHQKFTHEILGYQQRLDEIQAAVLRVKLRHLDDWIERRNAIARSYGAGLKGLPVKTPVVRDGCRHVFYVYPLRTPRRDELRADLAAVGIGTQIMYPQEVPYQPAYRSLGHAVGDFPVADALREEVLCLPMFPELTDGEVQRVIEAVRAFFKEARR
jgi:dTDP-4-amino-4,6-dideoxygalactose transaminase